MDHWVVWITWWNQPIPYATHIFDAAQVTTRVAQLAAQRTDQRAQQLASLHVTGVQTVCDLDQLLQRYHFVRLLGQAFQQPKLSGRKLNPLSIQPDTVLAGFNLQSSQRQDV